MLQKLNERIQGVIAWVVIALIAVTFTLFGVDYYLQSRHTSDVEVTVNNESISKQAFELSYRRNRQQRDPAKLTAASEKALKKQVLDDMVANLITFQGAKNSGFEVSADQANAAIISIPQFQQEGHFSSERYQQALSSAMFTPESFQREVRQGMLLNQQRFAFIGTAFALQSEVKRFVKLYMQTRDYDYLEIPANLFVDKSQVTDEQVASYYDKHKQDFVASEKVGIEYIRLSLHDLRESLKVTDEEIQKYYDENQNNYLTPAQWQVAHILFALPKEADSDYQAEVKQKAEEAYQALQNNPMQFSSWVKTLSSDKLSANNEGILPWISAGQTEFDKPLSTLSRPGQLSAPFKTSHGYEIFKLIGYKPAKLKPLADVKTQIAAQLMTESAQSRYAQALEQLTDLSYQSPDSLVPAAEALKLTIEKTEPFTREGGNTELTKNKQILSTAFSHDVMELKSNSEPVQLDNDSVIVLRVSQHLPATQKSLAEVRDTIISKIASQQAESKAKTFGQAILKNPELDYTTFDPSINSKSIEWHAVESATRDSDKADAMINDLAFSLHKLGSLDGRQLMNGSFVVVKLKTIKNGQYDKLDKEHQASLAQQIETSYGLMDYDLYINSLASKAVIDRPKS